MHFRAGECDERLLFKHPLRREPFLQDARRLFPTISTGQIMGYVTATTLTNIFYISKRQTRSVAQARQAVSETLIVMEICLVDRATLEQAFGLTNVSDFEDAVQIACAINQGLDAIVIRDQRDFLNSPIPVTSIADLFPQ
ncbi:type II toxin-antitoxin system VapC family toxin [Leptolyngbya sp. AN03gr2]|uniref:type II toxin-antitoxin system VapC family toxin n=1 Tax=unclassified Leptolyngbya TaxID=2650499 RepID=UPI003D312114